MVGVGAWEAEEEGGRGRNDCNRLGTSAGEMGEIEQRK